MKITFYGEKMSLEPEGQAESFQLNALTIAMKKNGSAFREIRETSAGPDRVIIPLERHGFVFRRDGE